MRRHKIRGSGNENVPALAQSEEKSPVNEVSDSRSREQILKFLRRLKLFDSGLYATD